MELIHLRYFVTAADEKNVSRAAVRLHISQPAVSRQIKDLEEELGVQLFKRLRDGLELTDAVFRALVHAREILHQAAVMQEAMTPFRGSSTPATFSVGYIPTVLPGFLARALRIVHQQHDGLRIQIVEMMPREQVEALREGRLDLALLGMPWPTLKKILQ